MYILIENTSCLVLCGRFEIGEVEFIFLERNVPVFLLFQILICWKHSFYVDSQIVTAGHVFSSSEIVKRKTFSVSFLLYFICTLVDQGWPRILTASINGNLPCSSFVPLTHAQNLLRSQFLRTVSIAVEQMYVCMLKFLVKDKVKSIQNLKIFKTKRKE